MRFLLTLALLLAPFTASAAVKYDEATRSITVTGTTTPYLNVMIAGIVNTNDVDTVFMSGPGGDFYAGLQIGRTIAKSGARVVIPSGMECISACALSAMAAREIHVDGALLLHRPYATGIPTMRTIEETVGEWGAAYLDMAIYLNEMGYNPTISKQIIQNSTPCKFMVVETGAEVERARETGFFVGFKTVDKCDIPMVR